MEDYLNTLTVTFAQLIYVSVLLERFVANIKNLKAVKSWHSSPVIASVGALVVCYMFNLKAITAGVSPQVVNDVWILKAGFVDIIVTAGLLSGGSSGVVETVRKMRERGDRLAEAKTKRVESGG